MIVTDFGIARTEEDLTQMTLSGAFVGTLAYAAPEQVAARRDLDVRVDVWALGVILYEILAGQRPFESPVPEAVLRAISEARPQSLGGLVEPAFRSLVPLARGALARDRSPGPERIETTPWTRSRGSRPVDLARRALP